MIIKIFMGIETTLLVYFVIKYMTVDKLLRVALELFSDEIDRMYKELMKKKER